MTVVLDLAGVGLGHLYGPFTHLIKDIVKSAGPGAAGSGGGRGAQSRALGGVAFEANYPQTLRYCVIVNAPAVFPMAYALVKPFLPDRTKRKIVVLRRLAVRWGRAARGGGRPR